MKKLNQRGFAGLTTALIIVVIVLVVGAGAFVLRANSHRPKDATQQTQSTTTEQTTKTQPAEQKATAKYLEIKEWGIKFKLTENIQDAYYDSVVTTQMDAFSLRTHSLDFEENCKTASQSIVSIFRVAKDAQEEIMGGGTYAHNWASQGAIIGDYFYFTEGAQYGCANTAKGQEILGKVRGEFGKAGATIEKL